MKRLLSLLLAVLMITSIANFSSIVNAVTSIDFSALVDESISENATESQSETDASTDAETEATTQATTQAETKSEDEVADNDGLVEKTVLGYYNGHTIQVSGMLPQVATLSLTSVDEETAQKLVSAKRSDGTAIFACDIKIIGADGKEWQPEDDKTVDIKVTGMEKTEKELQFIHVSEDVDKVLEMDNPEDAIQTITDVTMDKNGDVTFETDGFSVFSGFTVDFHYNGDTFSIGGMESVLLSEVFKQLEIDADIADVTDVTFTDDSLVKVEKQGDDWLLSSLQAFQSEEDLSITFKDGGVLVIDVTDANVTESSSPSVSVTSDTTYTFTTEHTSKTHNFTKSGSYVAKRITKACTLTVENNSGHDITFTRAEALDFFRLEASGAKLVIKGKPDARFIFDGSKTTSSVYVGTDGGSSSKIDLQYCVFKGPNARINISKSLGTLKLTNCTFQNMKLSGDNMGSAVYVNGAITNRAEFINCAFQDCQISCSDTDDDGKGGAIAFGTGASAKNGVIFKYDDGFVNTKKADKSAISSAFYNCTVTAKDKDNVGGAIAVACDGTADISDFIVQVVPGDYIDGINIFDSCSAFHSGAISFIGGGTAGTKYVTNVYFDYGTTEKNLTDGSTIDGDARNGSPDPRGRTGYFFKNCKAMSCGGVIHFQSSHQKIHMDGANFYGNTATDGGCFRFVEDLVLPDFTINDCIFDGNTAVEYHAEATYGGSVIRTVGSVGCKLTVNNSTFKNGKSHWSGAGIYWNCGNVNTVEDTACIIKNSMFDNNHAVYSGGAIFNEGEMSISNTVIKNNSAITNGGGIRTTLYDQYKNPDWYQDKVMLTLDSGCELLNNTAGVYGGGLAINLRHSKNIHYLLSKKIESFTFGCTITNGAVISGNKAGACGGGIYYGYGWNTGLTSKGWDSHFTDDVTKSVSSYTLDNLKSKKDVTPADQQKMINSIDKVVNIQGGEIYNNIAGYDGGGIYAHANFTDVTVSGGHIYGNRAGVDNVQLEFANCKKSGYDVFPLYISAAETYRDNLVCNAISTGVYFNTRTLVTDASVTGYGGGICVKGVGSSLQISNGNIGTANAGATEGVPAEVHANGNKADFGGGIAVQNATMKYSGGDVAYNYAQGGAGIFTIGSGTINMSDGNIHKNHADGKCTIITTTAPSSGTKVSSACKKSDNTINGLKYNDAERESTITNEFKTGSGGGINAHVGTVTLSGGNVYENTATNGGGGGIWVDDGGSVKMTGGKLYNNLAEMSYFMGAETTATLSNIFTKLNILKDAKEVTDVTSVGDWFTATAEISNNKIVDWNLSKKTIANKVFASDTIIVTFNDGTTKTVSIAAGTMPTGTTTYNELEIRGVGGAIGVGDGSSGNPSTYSLTVDPANTAIYGNMAYFAADDVYASGNYTKLTIPNTGQMVIPHEDQAVRQKVGWFEDFHTRDSNISADNSISVVDDTDLVERYKTAAQFNNYAKIFQIYDTAKKNTGANTFVNAENAYVNMTLGIIESGGLKIGKSAKTPNGTENNTNITEWNTFTVTKGAGDAWDLVITGVYRMNASNDMDGGTQLIAMKNEGDQVNEDYFETITVTGNTYKFRMKNGYYVGFDAQGNYTVAETAKSPNVTETTYKTKSGNTNGEETTGSSVSVTVTSTAPQQVEFFNKYSLPGKLRIIKNMVNAEGTAVAAGIESFKFNVSGTAASTGATTFAIAGVYTAAGDVSNATTAGVAISNQTTSGCTVTLKNGYAVDLTANGTNFTVTEVLENNQPEYITPTWRIGTDGDYTSSDTTSAMTVGLGADKQVEFRNIYQKYGTIDVYKHIVDTSGANIDSKYSEFYPFTLSGTAASGAKSIEVVGVYQIGTQTAVATSTNYFKTVGTPTASQYQFELKNGYYARFKALGTNFTVTEGATPNYITATNNTLNGISNSGKTTESFNVEDNSNIVKFTNTYVQPGTFSITKNVVSMNGTNLNSKYAETFYEFTITYDSTKDDAPVLSTANASAYYQVGATTTAGSFKFSIKPGHKVTFTGRGTTYKITETEPDDPNFYSVTNTSNSNSAETNTFTVNSTTSDPNIVYTNKMYSAGKVIIGKNVVNIANKNLNDVYNEFWTFRFNKVDSALNPTIDKVYKMTNNSVASGTEITDYSSVVTRINDFEYKIKNGYFVQFAVGGTYTVEETLTGNQNHYVISTKNKALSASGYTNGRVSNQFTVWDTTTADDASKFEFVNTIKAVSIELKYYDRKAVSGEHANISSTPTTFSHNYYGSKIYELTSQSGKDELTALIEDLAENFDKSNILYNVIDEYKLYQSQTAAKNATGHTYHHNQLGNQVAGTDEDPYWYNWYGTNGVNYSEGANGGTVDASKVVRGVVWYDNQLKNYTVTPYVFGDDINTNDVIGGSKSDTVELGVGEYNECTVNGELRLSPQTSAGITTAKYNQRLGVADEDTEGSEATNHLAERGLPFYTGKTVSTAGKVSLDGTNYYFSHWSYDQDGTSIVSTDYEYNLRVTNSHNIYAIYMKTPVTDRGLTVQANGIDRFVNSSNVEKVRLNTLMSPYNFPDDYQDYINKVAGIYVIASNNTSVITGAQIDQIRAEVLKYLIENGDSFNKDGEVKKLVSNVTDITGSNIVIYIEPELSNKNRLNLTSEFTASLLNGKRILCLAAMQSSYTNGDGSTGNIWRISDNVAEFTFDSEGVGSTKDINGANKITAENYAQYLP